ncbi:unnamed protein product, partial [Closterium sp. NIES-53]
EPGNQGTREAYIVVEKRRGWLWKSGGVLAARPSPSLTLAPFFPTVHSLALFFYSHHSLPPWSPPSEACGSKICDPTTDCVIDAAGGASCVCKAGYQSISGACVGPATCGSCPAGGTCTVAFGFIPYCICPPGYGMTSTGCINGKPNATCISSQSFPSHLFTSEVLPYCICPRGYAMTSIGCISGKPRGC